MIPGIVIAALATLIAATTIAQPFRDDFNSVTPTNFDSGGAVSRQFHLNAESYRHATTIARTAPARDLATSLRPEVTGFAVTHSGGTETFGEYVANNPYIDGVIALHRGTVVFEAYPRMEPWQRHFAWSVTKVLTSTALAVLVEAGQVDRDAPVDRYVPALKDSAWAGIPVQHVADMASGIDCPDSDGYQNTETCIYAMEESLGVTAPTGRELDFIARLQEMQLYRESGLTHEYVSANTNVLMLVIESVTGKAYAQAVQDLVWSRIGAEADALMTISHDGYAYASGGLSARLRDVARFGQVYAQPELSGVLSPATVEAIRSGGVPLSDDSADSPATVDSDKPLRGSWQWDKVWADGALFKGGYSGQGLYVDVERDLVVAWFGTGDSFDLHSHELLSVTRQLVGAGVFDISR